MLTLAKYQKTWMSKFDSSVASTGIHANSVVTKNDQWMSFGVRESKI